MPSTPPKLSLCMIVRDSTRTLRECLASIRPWVDEMIVVDTGSLDNTPDIAREFGAKVFQFEWCDDFSRARNESLGHATGDWLFWMDSDDRIDEENGRRLRDLASLPLENAPMAYILQVHCPGGNADASSVTVVDHVKLFRNRPELRFEGRIHEQIVPSIRKLNGEMFGRIFSSNTSGRTKARKGGKPNMNGTCASLTWSYRITRSTHLRYSTLE